MERGERPGRQRRRGLEPELEEADGAVGEHLGVDGARRGDDALDLLGQLRLGPDDALDAEMLPDGLRRDAPGKSSRDTKQIVARSAESVGDGAGDHVDFVEAGAGDQAGRPP